MRRVVPLSRPTSIRRTSTELTGTMTKVLGALSLIGTLGQCPWNPISIALSSLLSIAGAPRIAIPLSLTWAMESRPLITWASYRVLS